MGTHAPKDERAKVATLDRDSPRTKLKKSLNALEYDIINDALVKYKGNKKKIAEHLGISRSYLYKKLEEMQ